MDTDYNKKWFLKMSWDKKTLTVGCHILMMSRIYTESREVSNRVHLWTFNTRVHMGLPPSYKIAVVFILKFICQDSSWLTVDLDQPTGRDYIHSSSSNRRVAYDDVA
ncbi:hypothetical protein VitviT2T_003026 [Vitis vinifera]|uniref:DUF4283 domain-containing protein n=1 Tax=Vitis vinifera TaxID=29760 RepID=A0ABY9BKK8_VITVI|nr:hypothetical protein VitviT2T_003026 [Vitis vinifera]